MICTTSHITLSGDGVPNAIDKASVPDDQECFPEALEFALDVGTRQLSEGRTEPIAADAREGKGGKSDAKLKRVAGLLGVGFDQLKQRELQRRQKRLVTLAACVTVLKLVMAGLAVWALFAEADATRAREAETKQRIEAEANEKKAVASEKGAESSEAKALANLKAARQANYFNTIAHADALIANLQIKLARKLRQATPNELRHWEWGVSLEAQ
jgi:hypothetical protein